MYLGMNQTAVQCQSSTQEKNMKYDTVHEVAPSFGDEGLLRELLSGRPWGDGDSGLWEGTQQAVTAKCVYIMICISRQLCIGYNRETSFTD